MAKRWERWERWEGGIDPTQRGQGHGRGGHHLTEGLGLGRGDEVEGARGG